MTRTEERKAFTVRVDEWEYNWLMKQAHVGVQKPNRIIRQILSNYRELLEGGRWDLRGYFTQDEWGFMALALQGLALSTVEKKKIVGLLEDSKFLVAAHEMFPADLPELTKKILDNNFSALHTLSLCEIIRDFWDQFPSLSVVKWAEQQAKA